MPDIAEDRFAAIAREIVVADPRVASPETERGQGRRFGASGLKVDGKIFAMVSKGRVIFKLPRARVDQLVAAGSGTRFDPGHGRLMKEWVAIDSGVEADWLGLGREALAAPAR